MNYNEILKSEKSFDPNDWEKMEDLAHIMVKDMFGLLKGIRDEPVWKQPPNKIKNNIESEELPRQPQNFEKIYDEIKENLIPYHKGNIHPKFWSWVQGTGTVSSILSEILVAGLNPDVCTGDHSAMYIESQVIDWLKNMMGFPISASGVLVSGTSTANLTALLIARDAATNQVVRQKGMLKYNSRLIIYTSVETHSCIVKAADIMGLGRESVRLIESTSEFKIDIDKLEKAINNDKQKGFVPFCIVATVGTVNTGAIDPLDEINEICKREKLWLHIDGAFGAFAKLVPAYKERLKVLSIADSLAFDMHKWMSLPFGIGCLLVKDKNHHRRAFTMQPNYLQVHERGLASGPDPIFNYGIEMTRGFRALKVWMMLKEQGVDKIGEIVEQNIAQSFYLGELIKNEVLLELITPVTLNIVCFRFVPKKKMSDDRLNKLNREIVIELQELGLAATSHAYINNKYCIRVANVNHRSIKEDFESLVKSVVKVGDTSKYIV